MDDKLQFYTSSTIQLATDCYRYSVISSIYILLFESAERIIFLEQM